ncbi:MAG: TonB-dependent receptor [Gammaproteobacteria bacterium]
MKKTPTFLCLTVISTTVIAESEGMQPKELDDLIISTPLTHSASNTALPITILSGDELRLKAGNSVGDTLKNEPGIHSQSFGPGVGQPVIRGQTGSRAQVLQNGLGSLDASSLSPDHANSTEGFWADRIEVLRGPATLLYGSGAFGGVVNVIDNRIPDSVPEALIEGAVEQRYNSVNEGKSTAFKLEGGKGILAWHLDGFFRESIPMQIPGLAIDESTEAESHGETDHQEEPFNSNGRLLNTNARTHSGTAGFSVVDEKGFIGVSVNHLDNNYGVPPGAHSHDDEESIDPAFANEVPESVRIDLEQTRYDMKSEIYNPFVFAESLRMRLGYNDYRHVELENGQPGTTYSNEGFEGRLELIQNPWAIFDHGVVGVQTKNAEFAAIGDEAIVPRADINTFGFFTVQDIHTDAVTYEFGVRVDQQFIDAEGMKETSHTPVSGSASALWNVTEQDSISLSFTRAERAPDVQELFSNGPHLATRSFEIGNPELKVETTHNLELGFHIDRDWVQADLNVYQNWVQDYNVQGNTGEMLEGLPVFRAEQRDAEFQGFEAQITFPLMETGYGNLETQLFGDYVRGRFSDGGDIPRMPPLRYGTQLSWTHSDWNANIRLTRVERQDNPGLNETETAGYWLLNTSGSYKLAVGDRSDLFFFVKGNNLLDQEIRNSTSFLRNVAPEAARGVELGLRVAF